VKKIFTNARIYNQPDTIYYRCANELEKYITQFLNTLKDEKGSQDPEKKVLGVSKKIKKQK
jgi:histone acetyltransferase